MCAVPNGIFIALAEHSFTLRLDLLYQIYYFSCSRIGRAKPIYLESIRKSIVTALRALKPICRKLIVHFQDIVFVCLENLLVLRVDFLFFTQENIVLSINFTRVKNGDWNKWNYY